MAEISVIDTGVGIPGKDCDRIFNSFEQVDGSDERNFGGTGLGLSIVRHVVEGHGGKVTVKSVLDQGSTFSITIPKA